MKKLDRYILKEFLAPLALVVLGLSLLVLMVQVVATLGDLRDWGASAWLITLYHLAHFPFLVTTVTPTGVMLAALISLGGLARNAELTAARAGGVSGARLALPILAASLGVSLLLFLASEFIVPKASSYSLYIQKVLIQKRDMGFDVPFRSRMAKSLSGDRQLYCRDYNYSSGAGVMSDVIIITRQQRRISGRIDARSMTYDDISGWTLQDGVERTFDSSGEETALRSFKQWPIDISEGPRDFMVDSDKKEEDLVQLPMSELQNIIAVRKKTGVDFRKEQICLYLQVSYPLSCFILALLGVSLPFLFPSGRRAVTGAAFGILVSIGCMVLYLVLIQIGLSLGKTGKLPMLLSAWLGNLVFLCVGTVTLWKADR